MRWRRLCPQPATTVDTQSVHSQRTPSLSTNRCARPRTGACLPTRSRARACATGRHVGGRGGDTHTRGKATRTGKQEDRPKRHDAGLASIGPQTLHAATSQHRNTAHICGGLVKAGRGLCLAFAWPTDLAEPQGGLGSVLDSAHARLKHACQVHLRLDVPLRRGLPSASRPQRTDAATQRAHESKAASRAKPHARVFHPSAAPASKANCRRQRGQANQARASRELFPNACELANWQNQGKWVGQTGTVVLPCGATPPTRSHPWPRRHH